MHKRNGIQKTPHPHCLAESEYLFFKVTENHSRWMNKLIKASCTHCNLFAERNSKKREEKVKVIAVPAVNLLSLSPSYSPQSFVDIFLKINLAIISAVQK